MRFLVFMFLGWLGLGVVEGAPATSVGWIRIQGAIGPATASYLGRATGQAGAQSNACLVVQLDTPGGLLDSTKTMVQAIYESPVPVVVFVAPEGAGATSAGCFITLAADIAAMAPNTTIGAAHPVSIGGGPGTGESKPDPVMEEKVANYAVSYIEGIAEKRGRNVEWARASVRDSASITSSKALELGVIDLVARDLPDLLRQLDGREVRGVRLATAGAVVEEIPMIARERVFQLLWRPEVLFILMLVAIYGIIGELSNPGAILPGVAGVIALVLVLYMSAILPVNIAGLALIALAVVLFVIDVFAPTHGVLTAGGILSFALGALMLFNKAGPAFKLSLAFIIPGVVMTALFFVFVAGAGVRAQFLPVRAGPETLTGQTTVALEPIDARGGRVFVDGALWNAVSEVPVEAGRLVQITGREGLTLKVKPQP